MTKKLKIAIIDDDTLVVQLLGDYLNKYEEFTIWSTANSGYSFIETLEKQSDFPDVVLMDLKMKNGGGVEILEALKTSYPLIKSIVLTSYYKPSYVGHLLQLGANAFLSKETDKADLVEIIKAVMYKGNYFSTEQMDVLRQQISHRTEVTEVHAKNKLSEREIDVLKLICQQYTGKQIAEKLFLSAKTVETHKANLLLKTGVKNTAGLIVFAAQQCLVDLDEFVVIG